MQHGATQPASRQVTTARTAAEGPGRAAGGWLWRRTRVSGIAVVHQIAAFEERGRARHLFPDHRPFPKPPMVPAGGRVTLIRPLTRALRCSAIAPLPSCSFCLVAVGMVWQSARVVVTSVRHAASSAPAHSLAHDRPRDRSPASSRITFASAAASGNIQLMTTPKHDIANADLRNFGVQSIAWSERFMPVLRQVRERFEVDHPFDGMRFAACMHVTTETANLMRTLKVGGAEVALCASNPLSTQDETTAALVHEYDISVFARNGASLDVYYGHINSALDIQPDMVFDDGCDLVNTVHTNRTELLDKIKGGCEETTTGVVRLRQMASAGALRFPMVAVNDTNTKRMFDNRYGTGQSTMDAVMRCTNVLVAGSTVVVAGYGFCGKGVAQRAEGLGARIIVTETDPIKALDAVMQGYRVMPMEQAASVGDIFITVTSNREVLTRRHFEKMKDGAIIANAGHFDVEIDVKELKEMAKKAPSRIRHQTDQFILPSGNKIFLLGEGRLVNLAAAEGHPAAVMDMSFADQALTAEWLVKNAQSLSPEVHDVPVEIDQEVARLKLRAMGVQIDELTPSQYEYINSWEYGS